MKYNSIKQSLKIIVSLLIVVAFGIFIWINNRSSADTIATNNDKSISSICPQDQSELVLSVLNKKAYPVSGILFSIQKTQTDTSLNYTREISNLMTVDNTSLCLSPGTYSVKTGSSAKSVNLVTSQGLNTIYKTDNKLVNMTKGYNSNECKITKNDIARNKFQIVDFPTGKCLGNTDVSYLPKDTTTTYQEFKDEEGVTHSIPITDQYTTSNDKGLFNLDKPSDGIIIGNPSQASVRRIIGDTFYRVHTQPSNTSGTITLTINNLLNKKLIIGLFGIDEYSAEKELAGSGNVVFSDLPSGEYYILISSEKEGDIAAIDGDNDYYNIPGIDSLSVYPGSSQKVQINKLEQN